MFVSSILVAMVAVALGSKTCVSPTVHLHVVFCQLLHTAHQLTSKQWSHHSGVLFAAWLKLGGGECEGRSLLLLSQGVAMNKL